jgi:hypothetical protein
MLVALFMGSMAMMGAGCEGGEIRLGPPADTGVEAGSDTDVDQNGEDGCPDCTCDCGEECCDERDVVCECNAEAICTAEVCHEQDMCCDDDKECGCRDVDLDECCPELELTCNDITAEFCAECGHCDGTGQVRCIKNADGDFWDDNDDNCPGTWQENQQDSDNDGAGDLCDCDSDTCKVCNDMVCPCGEPEDPDYNPELGPETCCLAMEPIVCRDNYPECEQQIQRTERICLLDGFDMCLFAGDEDAYMKVGIKDVDPVQPQVCDGVKRDFCVELNEVIVEQEFNEGDIAELCAFIVEAGVVDGDSFEIVQCPLP